MKKKKPLKDRIAEKEAKKKEEIEKKRKEVCSYVILGIQILQLIQYLVDYV